MKALHCEQIRALEQRIFETGITSMELMERAGKALYDHVMDATLCYGKRICVVCGSGNNGGDGFVLARLLAQNKEVDSYVVYNATIAHLSDEAGIKANLLLKDGVFLHSFEEVDFQNFDIIVDCLFGIGLHREIRNPYANVIQCINASNAYVIACDIPSGVDGDRGCIMGCAIEADETISFLCGKLGFYRQDGLDLCGKVRMEALDVDPQLVEEFDGFTILEQEMIAALLPKRPRNSHKGSYGKVLVIGGRKGMSGAALLCTEAALRSGAGMVTLMSEEATLAAAAIRIPEATQLSLPQQMEEKAFQSVFSHYDCVAIGNGLGRDAYADQLVSLVWNSDCLGVFDGDALALIGAWKTHAKRKQPTILTPHPKEVSYLLGINTHDVVKNPSEALYRSEKAYSHTTLVLKNACTMISDGKQRYLNMIGNDALAKGGSGDVLCGIILGLFAQTKDPLAAALGGVYLHADCADALVCRQASHSILASDLIKQLPETMYEVLQKRLH